MPKALHLNRYMHVQLKQSVPLSRNITFYMFSCQRYKTSAVDGAVSFSVGLVAEGSLNE